MCLEARHICLEARSSPQSRLLSIEDGTEGMSSGSFSTIVETVAPERQCLTVLKLTDLMMESPIIRVDGGIEGAMEGT